MEMCLQIWFSRRRWAKVRMMRAFRRNVFIAHKSIFVKTFWEVMSMYLSLWSHILANRHFILNVVTTPCKRFKIFDFHHFNDAFSLLVSFLAMLMYKWGVFEVPSSPWCIFIVYDDTLQSFALSIIANDVWSTFGHMVPSWEILCIHRHSNLCRVVMDFFIFVDVCAESLKYRPQKRRKYSIFTLLIWIQWFFDIWFRFFIFCCLKTILCSANFQWMCCVCTLDHRLRWSHHLGNMAFILSYSQHLLWVFHQFLPLNLIWLALKREKLERERVCIELLYACEGYWKCIFPLMCNPSIRWYFSRLSTLIVSDDIFFISLDLSTCVKILCASFQRNYHSKHCEYGQKLS